jgi:hypothetical protein
MIRQSGSGVANLRERAISCLVAPPQKTLARIAQLRSFNFAICPANTRIIPLLARRSSNFGLCGARCAVERGG